MPLTHPKQGSLEYNVLVRNHTLPSGFTLMLYVVTALVHYILHTADLTVQGFPKLATCYCILHFSY